MDYSFSFRKKLIMESIIDYIESMIYKFIMWYFEVGICVVYLL